MARSLSEIYAAAKECRNTYLELTEFENKSKMSILDAFTWVTSTCIWTFENILDVFKIDLAKDLQNRVNGTPAYFANALLKYQSGDELVINDSGTSFSYASVDETKQIVKKVSYSESADEGFNDKLLVFKIATGTPGSYSQIGDDELMAIKNYLNKMLFAGQHARVVSRMGDVLVPKVTVYYDGAVSSSEVMANIKKSLNEFIAKLDFDGVVYVQKIIDCIQRVEHVTDVSMNGEEQGIFVAQYNDDNHIIVVDENKLQKIERYFVPNSGYIKESSCTGEEEGDLLNWEGSITLSLETAV